MVVHMTCHSYSNFYTSTEMGKQVVVKVLTSHGHDSVGSFDCLKN